MLPPKLDPRWAHFISRLKSWPVTGLATRMFISRLNIQLIFDDSPASRQDAIDRAYEFFLSNEILVQDDIRLIFGGSHSQ